MRLSAQDATNQHGLVFWLNGVSQKMNWSIWTPR
jgi:hypothetical protein